MPKTIRILITTVGVAFGLWTFLFFYLRSPILPPTKIQNDLPVSIEKLKTHVQTLSAISPPRQYQNQESMLKAEKYIEDEFRSYGYTVTKQEVHANNETYHNIIARFGDPNAKELIVIGAHYDVCGDQPGADDNASGVAGLLELARLFKEKNPTTEVPIEFVAYSLEEPPFFGGAGMGSAYHAEALMKAGVKARYMVSLEMIGYYSDDLFSQKFPLPILYALYPWRGNFIAVVGTPADRELVKKFKSGMWAASEISVYSIAAPRIVPGVDFSDHRSYWNFDWPAIMVTDTAFYRNHEYHELGDTWDRLDFVKMGEAVRGVFGAVVF